MNVIDIVKGSINDYALVLIGNDAGKHPIMVAASKSVVAKGFSSGKALKKIAGILGGNGGGKDDRAQGSVNDLSKLSTITKDFIL